MKAIINGLNRNCIIIYLSYVYINLILYLCVCRLNNRYSDSILILLKQDTELWQMRIHLCRKNIIDMLQI